MRFLSSTLHGFWDYLLVALLFFSPSIFGFTVFDGAAEMVVQWAAVILLVLSLFTRYELGLFKVVPMPGHLAMDTLVALFLLVSPWVFGFADTVWVPHVVLALGELLVVAVTQTATQEERQGRTVHQ